MKLFHSVHSKVSQGKGVPQIKLSPI